MTGFGAVCAHAVDTYNEYRSPMATAELLEHSQTRFVVRFTGPFSTTCCRDDYFADLIYELHELGVDTSCIAVDRIDRRGRETFVVTYGISSPSDSLDSIVTSRTSAAR